MEQLARLLKGKTLDEYTVGNAYVFPVKVEYDYEVQSKYIKALAHAWLVALMIILNMTLMIWK